MQNICLEEVIETQYDVMIAYYIQEKNQILALTKLNNEKFAILIQNITGKELV